VKPLYESCNESWIHSDFKGGSALAQVNNFVPKCIPTPPIYSEPAVYYVVGIVRFKVGPEAFLER
jgi:hypothetical protein